MAYAICCIMRTLKNFSRAISGYDVDNPPANKGLHEELRDKLRERVNAFVETPAKISQEQDLAYQLRASEFIKWESSKALRSRLREVKLLRGEAPPLGALDAEEYVAH